MRIIFYGSGGEVGRSCIHINTKHRNILLDAGIKLGEIIEYPTINEKDLKRFVKDIDFTFLSHAHLDHSGALPLFHYYGLKSRVFATSMTRRITKILLKDSYKISLLSHQHPAYKRRDIKAIINRFYNITPGLRYDFKGIKFVTYDAGHIPGSVSLKLELEGKKILYSGDINTIDTNLLYKANSYYGHIDIMIIESTYGDRNHNPRQIEERRFINDVINTIKAGKTALIAAFSVGRTQEIMLMLNKYNLWALNVPIIVDGMGIKVCREILKEPSYIRDSKSLYKALNKAYIVNSHKERERIIELRKAKIIISSAGMCSGGAIMAYLEKYYNDRNVDLFLTGWQAEHTNGRLLEQERKLWINGWKFDFLGNVKRYDFSAHAGLDGLLWLVDKVRPSTLLINHGDKSVVSYFAKQIKRKINIESIIPVKNNEVYYI